MTLRTHNAVAAMASLSRAFEALGVLDGRGDDFIESLPFSADDITAGSESELQAVVIGQKGDVDLPLVIERSNYYANIIKRIAAGDTSKRGISDLDRYLNENPDDVWENSWVRLPQGLLSPFAYQTFQADLLASKQHSDMGLRADRQRFYLYEQGEVLLRLPISYLLKLALAEVLGSQPDLPVAIRDSGVHAMGHFLNDNTSPETFSFHVVPLSPDTNMGGAIARETAKRFLLSHLLVMYANQRLRLRASGQHAMVYFAPHPPIRQKQLNNCLSDAFYRELFMSPCLSGWDSGEAKHAYMNLCHLVLSRSQLNAVAKLREAGIIVNNLVVLPNPSNISLANNGTHVSLGSRKLTQALQAQEPGFGAAQEKLIGDLTIKIVEHFLPLFVGTYSAAPYRIDFADFHPEKVLGFLPHELDYTHLRMIWQCWKTKARIKVFGQAVTPFGPRWADRPLSVLFRLRGDWVADFRLLDYLVALMSTNRSPALDGTLGNGERLKRDLADLGVFDATMSLYLLYRLREFAVMGFSGFEGRYYSLFDSFTRDMGRAVDLQTLVTALAFKYQAQGRISHAQIPDDPGIESERRQIFFGAAIGLPTFYVRRDTPNLFLQTILAHTRRIRPSRRHPGFLRVYNAEYCQALVRMLLEDAADLIEMFRLREMLADLQQRLEDPSRHGVAGRLIRGILAETGARSPMALQAESFNRRAEAYYRGILRRQHITEALQDLREDLQRLERDDAKLDEQVQQALAFCLGQRSADGFLAGIQADIAGEQATEEDVRTLINLVLLSLRQDRRRAEEVFNLSHHETTASSVC